MEQRVSTSEMTDEEFDRHVMRIIAREFGVGGLARFISLHRSSGRGDYTRDRHKWQDGLTVNDILRDLDAEQHP